MRIAGRRGHDLNRGIPEYEAGVLTTRTRRSVNSDRIEALVNTIWNTAKEVCGQWNLGKLHLKTESATDL
jgi:hypothetical protein